MVNTLLSLVRDIERDMEQLQERRRPRAKSKLDILTDTMIEFEAGRILFSENAKNQFKDEFYSIGTHNVLS